MSDKFEVTEQNNRIYRVIVPPGIYTGEELAAAIEKATECPTTYDAKSKSFHCDIFQTKLTNLNLIMEAGRETIQEIIDEPEDDS